ADAREPLQRAATDAEVALLAVPQRASWRQVSSLAGALIDQARDREGEGEGEVLGDLFATAQTIASLTGGLVSIEDTASRVLAYSRSDDEVDELRRLSILGRQGPQPYLAMLREWGVYARLRSSERVVRVQARPELGIRTRIAIGVHAGERGLGTIWVQEGSTPLRQQAERALLGAARVTALQLVRALHEPNANLALREKLLAGLLEGRLAAASVAAQIGADVDKPAAVLAFALPTGGQEIDRPELELRRSRLGGLISMYAAAFRRSALMITLEERAYVLVPDLRGAAGASGALALAREVVAAAQNTLGLSVRGALGSIGENLAGAAASRLSADRLLDAMAEAPSAAVESVADWQSEVLLRETLGLLAEHTDIRDPRVEALRRYDSAHGSALAASVSAYLEAFGDVGSAAQGLHVHPNTLRYRIKRAGEVSGIDLRDPGQRQFTQLQLRLPGAARG
ncbi:MAG: PucR family transcriptional regulator, partial [Sciscionella sp.]